MIANNSLHPTPCPKTYRVLRNGRELTFSYQQLFDAGYRYLLAEDYSESSRIFELLTHVSDRGPRAHILLAFCQAQLRAYTACSQTLNKAFDSDRTGLETKLHGAFVFWACGLLIDARIELEAVIQENPQLPTLSLLLADLLARAGNQKQPPRLWRSAVQNDRRDGAVGLIARRELKQWLAIHNSGKPK